MIPSVTFAKSLARDYIRKTRKVQEDQNQLQADKFTTALLSLITPKTKIVAAYLPIPGEPPIRPALQQIYSRGIKILVPIVEAKRELSWVYWSPEIAHPVSTYGIEEPQGQRYDSEKFFEADLHLIPALAFDVSGRRLGQGGAFYDTLLAQTEKTRSPSFVGIVFEREIKDAVPAESHDAQLRFLVTEKGVRDLYQD